MSEFGDIVRKHGFRNTGDNLLGFQIDMDAYLEESDLFEWIDVKRTGNDNCMLAAKCKLKADISIARAREDVCRIWEGSLRYSNFAEHSLEETPTASSFTLSRRRLHLVLLVVLSASKTKANKPAAPNAGIASQLTISHHWPGVGELGRSAV